MSMQAKASPFRAIGIQNTLGTRRAAGYLRNRHVSLEEALAILAPRRWPWVSPGPGQGSEFTYGWSPWTS